MGGGWLGGGWQGGGWQGGGWQGGGWSGGGGGGVPTFAMRADKPLADFAVTSNLGATFRGFPNHLWDADLWSLTILPEFFGLPSWETRITVPAPAAITQAEIDRLLVLAVTERPQAMGEIIQQHQNFQVAWLQLLMIEENTHPCTFLLMKLAARVGETLMIHYKRKFDRPRPSQVCPTLFPPVPVPGHGAYPAGHALISQLTSRCLSDVVPSTLHSPLLELARRCGFNRVIAGLHYESDCDAGVYIADQAHAVINDCPTYKLVKQEIVKRGEW